MDDLLTQFRSIGVRAEAAVEAWTGLKPRHVPGLLGGFGGFSNWNYLFTRWRAVALFDGQIGVWSTWTGVPSRRMHHAPVSDLRLVKEGRRYDRFSLSGYRFWVSSADRDELMGWIPQR